MKIIISPAKKMIEESEILVANREPVFQERAMYLGGKLRGYSVKELQHLMSCNEKIAQLNYDRFQNMDISKANTPALLAYEGLQYQYMAPSVFEKEQWEYVQEHLYILSGFYGILKPLDGIVPYRLEMQTKLDTKYGKDLYHFWKNAIFNELVRDNKIIINLASKEYSKVIEPYLTTDIQYITCVFGTLKDGKVKVKATEAKMARGEMVRYMAEQKVQEVEGIKCFHRLGFTFAHEYSEPNKFVFLKGEVKDDTSDT